MATFTSSLPDDLLKSLAEKAEYIKSYKRAGDDIEILSIAEEGMEDYFNKL